MQNMNQRMKREGMMHTLKIVLSLLVVIGVSECGGNRAWKNDMATRGYGNPLAELTVVGKGKESGEQFKCDISMVAGSQFFEKHVGIEFSVGRITEEERDALQRMVRVLMAIIEGRKSIYGEYEKVKEKCIIKEFTSIKEYERVRKVVERMRIEFGLKEVPLTLLEKTLKMSNVYLEMNITLFQTWKR
jgi:hypothetical protein